MRLRNLIQFSSYNGGELTWLLRFTLDGQNLPIAFIYADFNYEARVLFTGSNFPYPGQAFLDLECLWA